MVTQGTGAEAKGVLRKGSGQALIIDDAIPGCRPIPEANSAPKSALPCVSGAHRARFLHMPGADIGGCPAVCVRCIGKAKPSMTHPAAPHVRSCRPSARVAGRGRFAGGSLARVMRGLAAGAFAVLAAT